ncbi:hypothetical protein SCHPADRAFT_797549, partial [Schizopora paradoxa]
RAAKKQPNGGILFELNSAESASWLKKADVKALFAMAFDPGSKVKGSSYPCLLKFVPVAYQVDDRDEREEVEKAAGLPVGSMIESRWMKPPRRRERNQRYAHLIAMFPTPETANLAIREGLYIRGARIMPMQLFPEPMRCNHCSRFANHKAIECKGAVACGMCSKEHKTHLCSVRLPEHMFCVNCQQWGHGAISRDCPTYWAKKKAMDARNPATRFKYVVITTDPSTW